MVRVMYGLCSIIWIYEEVLSFVYYLFVTNI